MVKNLPAMKETQVQSLGWEHPIGNGNLLQFPCLQNSMDGGAGQATVHGITELEMTVQHNNNNNKLASAIGQKLKMQLYN